MRNSELLPVMMNGEKVILPKAFPLRGRWPERPDEVERYFGINRKIRNHSISLYNSEFHIPNFSTPHQSAALTASPRRGSLLGWRFPNNHGETSESEANNIFPSSPFLEGTRKQSIFFNHGESDDWQANREYPNRFSGGRRRVLLTQKHPPAKYLFYLVTYPPGRCRI